MTEAGEKPQPTATDNFNAMLRKIQESNNTRDEESARRAIMEAKEFGARIISAFLDSSQGDRAKLRDFIDRRTIIRIDMMPDIYDVLTSSQGAKKAVVHELLNLPPDTPRPTNRRAGI